MSTEQDFDVGALYGRRYVKAADLNGKSYMATIVAVTQVEFPNQGGGVQVKAVLTLQDWSVQLALNKTNCETIAAAYARQSSGWRGKQIEVYPDTVFFDGRSVACVRVRIPRHATSTSGIQNSPAPGPITPAPTTVPPNGGGGGLPY